MSAIDQQTRMQLAFAGPLGRYEIIIREADASLEDASISVVTDDGDSRWHVEVDETKADGERTLSGMTADGSGLWFELRLGAGAQISYWADCKIVRVDRAV
jgi:hypothetical protein